MQVSILGYRESEKVMPRGIYVRTDEHKKKIGDAERGDKNPNFGRHWTEEEKIRMGKGRKRSEETKQKIRESRKGLKLPKESTVSLSKRNIERYKDPAARKKMSDAVKKSRTPDIIANVKKLSKQRWQDPEFRASQHISRIRSWDSESRKMRRVELNIGGFWYGNVRYNEGPQYCELWNENLRERCRTYFNHVCVECGTPQNGRKLAIHHVHYNKKSCCDGSPRDLVALCTDCHGATNHNRAYWEQHFTEMLHGYYGGKSFFTKEEYAAYKNSV